MMKKISLFCLIIVMIMTSVVCVPFASATEAEVVSQSSQLKFLKAIGILDDALALDTPVTRGVFAKYVARLYGEVPKSTAAAQKYFDVIESADYCSAISLLTDVGLLNGYGDGTFLPERPISLSEAAKVTVDLLGYKYLANINGGYPTGYAIAAQNLGLLKGLDTNQTYFYGADLARLIYNAIDVDVLMENGVIKGDAETSVTMEKIKGHTILTEKLNMYKGEGVVYANAITNLNGASVNKRQLWIDNFAVTMNDLSYFDMVGCYVEYVYYQGDNSNEKVLVYAETEENSVLSLTKETFLDINGLKVTYSDLNGKVKKANLDTNVKFVYNGDVSGFDSSKFTNFKAGTITLLDYNNDGSYDVVKVENYTSFIVENVNNIKMIVDEGMKIGAASIDLTADKYTAMQLLGSDNAEITFDSISKGCVVSYYKNLSGNFLKVYVSKNVADGELKSIGTSGGNTTYQIGDFSYSLSAGYTGETAQVGDAITAYLDVFGYIAGIKMGIDDGLIAGFLLTGRYDKNGFTERYGFKIYTSENEAITAYAEDKIYYNGVSTDIDALPASLPQGIICYKLDEKGSIVAIETPTSDKTTYDDGRLLTIFPKGSSYYYSRMFDSKYIFDNTSVLFKMPEQYDAGGNQLFTEYTESTINAVTYNDISDRTDYTIEAYTLSAEAPRLKAVIIYDNNISTIIPRRDNLATIVESKVVLNEKGMDVYEATVLVEGVEKKLTLAETITEYKETIVDGVAVGSTSTISRSALKPGDTFRYGTNSQGELDKLEMVFTVSDGWKYTWYKGYSVNEVNAELAYGKVLFKDSMFTRVLFDNESYTGFIQEHYAFPNNHYNKVTVITLGARGCTVTSGSIQDAMPGDYIINYRYLMEAVGFVIIKDQR